MAYRRRYRKSYRPYNSSKTRFWYIGKRNKNNEIIGLLIAAMLIGGGAWASLTTLTRQLLLILAVLILSVLLIALAGLTSYGLYRQQQRARALSSYDVDHMDPFKFEHYVSWLMQHQGFTNVQVTQASGDYGVDVTATKDGQKWATQVKHYYGSVNQDAIRQAVAGASYYKCARSMVVTTAPRFTHHAKELAKATNTVLIARDQLADWIIAFQTGKS